MLRVKLYNKRTCRPKILLLPVSDFFVLYFTQLWQLKWSLGVQVFLMLRAHQHKIYPRITWNISLKVLVYLQERLLNSNSKYFYINKRILELPLKLTTELKSSSREKCQHIWCLEKNWNLFKCQYHYWFKRSKLLFPKLMLSFFFCGWVKFTIMRDLIVSDYHRHGHP